MSEISLKNSTPIEWVSIVEKNFGYFLKDHAACERKASATGINFVVQYPDRHALIEPMIRMAREELLHFQQVCRLLYERGLTIAPDEKNLYVNALHQLIRTERNQRLLDRLLITGIIESRGYERFSLLAENLTDLEIRAFYRQIADSEKRHQCLFLEMAKLFFKDEEIDQRLEELLLTESKIIRDLPLRSAVH